ncbi:MAG: glycosyltransferase [Bacteroidetes bacterium]|nr:MAG: glycosyltransferase [Bacteroidota bacterium]
MPFPPLDGGNIAMFNIAKSLADNDCEVHQFALNTNKHYVTPESLPSYFHDTLHFDSVSINTNVTLGGALKNLFGSGSYNVDRFYSKEVEEKISGILSENDFDIVQLETLFACPYIPVIRKNSQSKIVLRAHNAERVIWKRLSEGCRNPLKKIYLKFLASRIERYEKKVLEEIDALVPITPVDADIFISEGYSGPMLTVPIGLDGNEYSLSGKRAKLNLFHIGSMDWLPNQEAVKWFVEKCWDLISTKHPGLQLHLAGRGFPSSLMSVRKPGINYQGKVDDAMRFMSDKQVMVVPIRSGSGMRVKIVQGLALGKTIISTSIGAEGIDVIDGENILIADTPEEFQNQISKCIADTDYCYKIGENGRKLFEAKYSNEALGKSLKTFYETLIS